MGTQSTLPLTGMILSLKSQPTQSREFPWSIWPTKNGQEETGNPALWRPRSAFADGATLCRTLKHQARLRLHSTIPSLNGEVYIHQLSVCAYHDKKNQKLYCGTRLVDKQVCSRV